MSRRPRNYSTVEGFMRHVNKNPQTKCWDWTMGTFRFRISHGPLVYVHNPRRYCAFIHGYNIQLGRHVINGCSNPMCVNPEHTMLKHNGQYISKNTPFYLTFRELLAGSNDTRHHYGRKIEALRDARERTLQLIIKIRHMPKKLSAEDIANNFDISPGFVREAKEITGEYFHKRLKVDPYDTGDTPVDEQGEDIPKDAVDFYL